MLLDPNENILGPRLDEKTLSQFVPFRYYDDGQIPETPPTAPMIVCLEDTSSPAAMESAVDARAASNLTVADFGEPELIRPKNFVSTEPDAEQSALWRGMIRKMYDKVISNLGPESSTPDLETHRFEVCCC